MPGSRDGNLRSGDQNEQFGLQQLCDLAFVAPVPRPEDVGIDAVATIIRRDRRRLFAEESFLVQAKSSSVRLLKFNEPALNWLRAQLLPLYVLSADRKTQTVELYSLSNAMGHPNCADVKTLTIHLDDTQMSIDGGCLEVWLGPPILRWNSPRAAKNAYQKKAYVVLKAWTAFDTASIALRRLGLFRQLSWQTNKTPVYLGRFMIMGPSGGLAPVLENIRPHIQRLISELFPPERASDDLMIGLLHLCQYMRSNGVDPDPSGILQKLIAYVLQSRANAEESVGTTQDNKH